MIITKDESPTVTYLYHITHVTLLPSGPSAHTGSGLSKYFQQQAVAGIVQVYHQLYSCSLVVALTNISRISVVVICKYLQCTATTKGILKNALSL